MRGLGKKIFAAASARALTPLILGAFFLVYIGTASMSDEPLVTLMGIVRTNTLLVLLAALIPVNLALRAVGEASQALRRRAPARGMSAAPWPDGLFATEVELPTVARWEELPRWLEGRGLRTVCRGETVTARRGVSLAPARVVFLLGCACLVAGVLASLLTRESHRTSLIEGEPLPQAVDSRAVVERIILSDDPQGIVLDKRLSVRIGGGAGGTREFRLYPPGRIGGYFVYPRYLGIAPLVALSAPDLPPRPPSFYTLTLYPPGREDAAEFTGTPYKVRFSLEPPASGADPFVSGEIVLLYRVVRGETVLFEGRMPVGGSVSRDGVTLAIPEVRRLMVTDFIRDHGFLLIWFALLLMAASLLYWVPVRIFAPRVELLFCRDIGRVHAGFRAEGGSREQAGVFHEALDLLSGERHG
jgi:hypothetical protein